MALSHLEATDLAVGGVRQQQQEAWTESAYDWLQRARRRNALAEIPTDPSSAAWSFLRPSSHPALQAGASSSPSSALVGGTGIAFIDAVLRRQIPDHLPVVDIRGDALVGKTSTLLTLAARYVVATRPSLFTSADTTVESSLGTMECSAALPQVILLDSAHNITVSKLTYVVRSTLLRQSTYNSSQGQSNQTDEESFQCDMISCLSRIHLISVGDPFEWVPILESLRSQLAPTSSDHPTLLLWDDFLDDCSSRVKSSAASHMEVIRQVARLLQDCSVCFVSTNIVLDGGGAGAGRRRAQYHDWEKHVTHRIKLERNSHLASTTGTGQEYLATIHGGGSRIPFSISLAGILS